MEKKLAEALMRVGRLEGVTCVRNEADEIGITAGHLDDYILAYYLGTLLENGAIEFKIAPSKYEYACKLLHMKAGE